MAKWNIRCFLGYLGKIDENIFYKPINLMVNIPSLPSNIVGESSNSVPLTTDHQQPGNG